MDMNTHALCVDIGYLEEQCLMQSQTAGVNGGQIGFVLWCIYCVDDIPDLIET
jgi:hypothetical protein